MSEQFYTGCVMLRDPKCLLIGVNGSAECPVSVLGDDAFLEAHKECVVFFVNPMWSLHSEWFRSRVLDAIARQHRKFPRHKIVMLVNDHDEMRYLADLPNEVARFICGEIAATYETLFEKFSASVEVEYDAVYIARPEAYKRIELAREVKSLAVIARGLNQQSYNSLLGWAPNAAVPNLRDDGFYDLRGHEVAQFLPKAQCGLILSAVEGQNRATTEYLLAGLPVVTTSAVGGRHRLLHPGNSVVVEATPSAVRAGVEFVCSHKFDRMAIQKEAVSAIRREKLWLRFIVDDILRREGLGELGSRELAIPHHGSSSSQLCSAFS